MRKFLFKGVTIFRNMSLLTTITIDLTTLINYAGANMLIPLKRSGLLFNLTLSLNPLAVLNRISQLIKTDPSAKFFTSIVCPTLTQPNIQNLSNQLPFAILLAEEADFFNYRRHMPTFLIECFFASNSAQGYSCEITNNRQILAQSCLPMLYNKDTHINTGNYDPYLEPTQNITFQSN